MITDGQSPSFVVSNMFEANLHSDILRALTKTDKQLAVVRLSAHKRRMNLKRLVQQQQRRMQGHIQLRENDREFFIQQKARLSYIMNNVALGKEDNSNLIKKRQTKRYINFIGLCQSQLQRVCQQSDKIHSYAKRLTSKDSTNFHPLYRGLNPSKRKCQKLSIQPFLNIESLQPYKKQTYRKNSTIVKQSTAKSEEEFTIRPQTKKKSTSIRNQPSKKLVKHIAQLYKQRKCRDPSISYRDLLWKVCYSFGLSPTFPQKLQKNYKYYVGKGNNSRLIRSIMSSRSWWTPTDKLEPDVDFVWTQLRVGECFQRQKPSRRRSQIFLQKKQVIGQKIPCQSRLLNPALHRLWNNYFSRYYRHDYKSYKLPSRDMLIKQLPVQQRPSVVHNHLFNNIVIGNKKALYYTLRDYCEMAGVDLYQLVPKTFHIKDGMQDPQYAKFLSFYQSSLRQHRAGDTPSTLFIVKPGQLTNRGNGITVVDSLQKVKNILRKSERHANGSKKTYIVQQYIDKPLLYNRRKFDIRHYMLVVAGNASLKGYWYQQGYVRTASQEFSLNSTCTIIHLTNDAVQKNFGEYGKYQKGNKLSYSEFQNFLQKQHKKSFSKLILPQMKHIATQILRASFLKLDPKRLDSNFQLFGLDFMIDQNYKPWLIECNSNPCLQISSPGLGRLIPALIENSLRIGLDWIYQPPSEWQPRKASLFESALERNRFELIFDQEWQGEEFSKFQKKSEYEMGDMQEQEQFEDLSQDET